MNPMVLYYANIASGVLLHRNDSYYDDAQASTLVAATGGTDVLTNKRNNRSNGIGKSRINADINSTSLNNINSDYNRPSFNTTRFTENSTNAEPYSATNSRVENDEKSLFTPTGSRSTNSSSSHREQPNLWWWSWSTRSNDDDDNDGRGDIYVENERDNRRLVLEVDKRTTAVTSNSVARHHQSHSHQYYHRQQRFSVAKYQNNFGPQNGVTSSGHNQHDRHNRSSADNNGEMPYVYEWINRLQRLFPKDNVPYKGDIYNNIFNDTTVFYGDNFTTNYSNVTTDNGEKFCHPDAIASNVQAVQYISYGICIPIVASIGILVNLASLIVLTRPSMRSSVYMYLAGLSFFDCLLLLLSVLIFPALIYCELACNEHSAWCRYMKATMLFTYPLMNIAQTGSIWTLTAITVDRFVAITWPLKSRDWLTVSRTLIVLAVIFIWSVIYNIPLFFELEWQANGQLDLSWLRKDPTYVVYKNYCYLLLMFVVPAVTMIVLNVFVTLAVRRAYTVRRQLSGRDEKERRCTVMAVLVVGTFLVLNFVANIANCIETFNADSDLTDSLRPVTYIGNLLVTVNSATNFFIYCALSLRFRQTFCKLFCPVCYTPEKEYQFLSAYFGSGRGNNAAGVDNAGGIISMRSIRRPLISSPRSSLQHHQQQQRTGGSVTRFNSNNNSISNAPGNNDSSPNAFGGSNNNNNNNNGSGRKPPMKVDFSQRNKNLVTRRTPIYD